MTGVYYAIGVGYIMYYGANIAYDLFLKKEKNDDENIQEEISLESLVDENVTAIGIDDVENVSVPSSFQEKNITDNLEKNEELDIDELRERFEAEGSLDEDKVENVSTHKSLGVSNIDIMSFLNDAETNIQLVDNVQGLKTYKIKNLTQ